MEILRRIPYLVTVRQLLIGIVSFLGIDLVHRTGGTNQARYCYSVWMRHLHYLAECGMTHIPYKVVELGPGDSLGIGLCAMLSGAEEYYALDIVKYANTAQNSAILEELVGLFRRREAIPDDIEFPRISPTLEDYSFPFDILKDDLLNQTLCEERIEKIRDYLKYPKDMSEYDASGIYYVVPWTAYKGDYPEADIIISQAVLEHVDELEKTYQIMDQILIPGGFMSHQIDFKSHGTSLKWNGHWSYTDNVWKAIRGKRAYLINRLPLKKHLVFASNYFEILKEIRTKRTDGISFLECAQRYMDISEDDFVTAGAFLVMKKPE